MARVTEIDDRLIMCPEKMSVRDKCGVDVMNTKSWRVVPSPFRYSTLIRILQVYPLESLPATNKCASKPFTSALPP